MWVTRLHNVIFSTIAPVLLLISSINASQPVADAATVNNAQPATQSQAAVAPVQNPAPANVEGAATPASASTSTPTVNQAPTPTVEQAGAADTAAPKTDTQPTAAPVATPATTQVAPVASPADSTATGSVQGQAVQQPASVEKPIEKPAVIPSEPAPEVVKTPQEEALGDDASIIGIDTVELQDAQGNWLFKRLWWERAEDKYEKIRKQVASIMESRGQFFDKRNNAEKNIFDKVYQEIGFERGELDELINRLIDRMNKLREREGTLDEREREFYAQLQAEKKSLDTIKTNVNAINVLENSIDEVVAKLMETINRVREYEQEAWQNFKDIARVLDDRKAKEMFYKIDAIWRNVTSLKDYIQTRLSAHFDQLLAKAQEETDRVAKSIQELKEKGLDLQKQEEAILQYDREKETARIRAIEDERRRAQEEKEEAEKEEEGFFTSYVWNPIKSIITWPYYAIFGQSEEDEDEETTSKLVETEKTEPVIQEKKVDQQKPLVSEKQSSLETESEAESQEEKGFIENYILDPLKYMWDMIVYLVTWPYYAIVGSSQEEISEDTDLAPKAEQPKVELKTEVLPQEQTSPSGSEITQPVQSIEQVIPVQQTEAQTQENTQIGSQPVSPITNETVPASVAAQPISQ